MALPNWRVLYAKSHMIFTEPEDHEISGKNH